MGLFSRKKKEYRNIHPTEWYLSEEGKICYEEVYDPNAPSDAMDSYYTNFISSIPAVGKWIPWTLKFYIRLIMQEMNTLEFTDVLGNRRPAKWVNWPNIVDKRKNKFVEFLTRLNHPLSDVDVLRVIASFCIESDFDLDGKDEWLLNADFWKNSSNEYEDFLNYIEENDIRIPKNYKFLAFYDNRDQY